jgi:hypothetical protein
MLKAYLNCIRESSCDKVSFRSDILNHACCVLKGYNAVGCRCPSVQDFNIPSSMKQWVQLCAKRTIGKKARCVLDEVREA